MPRMRTLKPQFFTDEDVAELTPWARLLFMGLWTLADRSGRVEERQQFIRVQVFPYDDLEAAHVRMSDLLDELSRERRHRTGSFVTRYEIDGKRYIQINAFEKHQKCHPHEAPSEIPPAPSVTKKPRHVTASNDMPRRVGGKQALNLNSNLNQKRTTDSAAGAAVPATNWSQEAADDFRAAYRADPPVAFFGHVKPIARKYGWSRTRPALQAYLRETPIELLNVAKVLPVRIEGGHSLSERSPPAGKWTAVQPPPEAISAEAHAESLRRIEELKAARKAGGS